MTLIATIAAIALVAVGIGYAYTAMTTNTGNTASPEYITVVQGSTGAYQFANDSSVYWNTNDHKVAAEDPFIGGDIEIGDYITVFSLAETATTITPGDGNTYKVVQLGGSFDLKFAPQSGGNALAGLKCAVSTTSGFPVQATGTFIFLKVTTAGKDYYMMQTAENTFKTYVSAWNQPASFDLFDATTTTYNDATVTVYYGYNNSKDGVAVEHAAGAQPTGAGVPSAKPINNANLTFTVDTGLTNPTVYSKDLSGISFSVNPVAITGKNSGTTVITFNPAADANMAISIVSGTPAKAVATYDSSTKTITVHSLVNETVDVTFTVTPVDTNATAQTFTVNITASG